MLLLRSGAICFQPSSHCPPPTPHPTKFLNCIFPSQFQKKLLINKWNMKAYRNRVVQLHRERMRHFSSFHVFFFIMVFLAVRKAGSAILGLLQVDHRSHLTQNYLSVYACCDGLMMCLSTLKSVLN